MSRGALFKKKGNTLINFQRDQSMSEYITEGELVL